MTYPKFYDVDGELVVVTEENGDVVGRLAPRGIAYPPFKATTEGEELSQAEFLAKVKEKYPNSKLF